MVLCLERDADLHMAQLMPLPLTLSCFSKIQIGFTFLVPAHPGVLDKGPLNMCNVFCSNQSSCETHYVIIFYLIIIIFSLICLLLKTEKLACFTGTLVAGTKKHPGICISAALKASKSGFRINNLFSYKPCRICCKCAFVSADMYQSFSVLRAAVY